MPSSTKYQLILDAIETLLKNRDAKSISVNDIAKTAGIGKGSIYYYFSSKNEILEALIQRNYQKVLENACTLASQSESSPFGRMAKLFQLCHTASMELNRKETTGFFESQEAALIHQKYVQYMIQNLKPVLCSIIQQGIEQGLIRFPDPAALSEIVLIILTFEMDDTIAPKTPKERQEVLNALISLLENGTFTEPGSLDFLREFY